MSNISGCTGPIFAIFSPYKSALRAHDGSVSYFPVYQQTLPVHVVVRRIMSNISGCTGPIFAIFTPYESALRDHDGSVSYFPVYQETLPWQQKMWPK